MPDRIEYEQVIVVDWSLKMKTGKLAAQVAHAAMQFLITDDPRESEFSKSAMDSDFDAWAEDGCRKIVLRAETPQDMNSIEDAARESGLRVRVVIDSGDTVFKGIPTKTALCIGPNDSKVIDSVTCKLKLL